MLISSLLMPFYANCRSGIFSEPYFALHIEAWKSKGHKLCGVRSSLLIVSVSKEGNCCAVEHFKLKLD